MGWRYLLFVLGGLNFLFWTIRFFAFKLYESPRFLAGLGKDQEAVDIIHSVARYNGKASSLTVEELAGAGPAPSITHGKTIFLRTCKSGRHNIEGLFRSRKLGLSTSLLILIWGMDLI